jgi:hypothetical protein
MTYPANKRAEVIARVHAHGSLSRAARECGVQRSTVYSWRDGDETFASAVEHARQVARQATADELVEKATAACGHVYLVPVTDHHGNQLMEEVVDEGTGEVSLRPAFRRELRHHDSRIMAKMLDKFVDGPVQRVDSRNLNAEVSPEQASGRGVRVVILDAEGEELE